MRRLGELARQRRADMRRTREQQAVDLFPGQVAAHIAAAVDKIQNALGQARLGPQPGHEIRHSRRLFRRLEHNHIPGQQRRHDMAIGQMRREVIRAEHGQHAVRLVTQHLAHAGGLGCLFTRPLGLRSDGDLHLGGDAGDFGAGFPQWLASFARNHLGEGVSVGFHGRLEGADDGDAFGQRPPRPTRRRSTGARQSGRHAAHWPGPDRLARAGIGGDEFSNRHGGSSCRA